MKTASKYFIALITIFMMIGCDQSSIERLIMKQAFPTDYFEAFKDRKASLNRVSENVYAFAYGESISLVLKTEEGLAVFDTFSEEFTLRMKEMLLARFPNLKIKWVFYSHNHLDHIRGSANLEPEVVVGHKDINALVSDWPKEQVKGFSKVTQVVDGDTSLNVGGVEVKLLYMPQSHSLTLYGFYLPSEGVVYAPDMMFVKTLPPFGFPDWYYPGYMRALDRLISLDANHYIPSHFDFGDKQDLIDYRNMMFDFREEVFKGLKKRNFEAANGENARAILDEAYPVLKEKYGSWHGFGSMFIPHFAGQIGGSYLGY